MKRIPSATSPRRTVLLVDDHPMMRRGLAELINEERDLKICGEAEDEHQTMKAIKAFVPDLVLVDLGLPGKGGLELIKDIRAQYPGLLILVNSIHDELLYAGRSLRAGANGYIMKDQNGETILAAIRKVLKGESYVSEKMSAKILTLFSGRKPTELHSPVERLSDREFEVFEMIGQGKTTGEMARQLCLSSKTVDAHRGNIKRKLKLQNGSDLIRYAVRWVETEQLAPTASKETA